MAVLLNRRLGMRVMRKDGARLSFIKPTEPERLAGALFLGDAILRPKALPTIFYAARDSSLVGCRASPLPMHIRLGAKP